MKIKRVFTSLLALALLCGTFVPVTAQAADAKLAPFVDIQDPQVSEAAELLRLLGVVDGVGNNVFAPARTLTRAEFCKMAVELMGNGDKVPAQMNRTIFQDVSSTHWARGYINVATQGVSSGDATTPGIIRGDETGRFHPDDHITYAEAVTILMRVLGYTDSDVGFGAAWYDGYLSTAASIDLTEDLSLAPADTVARGQAAILFKNLIFADIKDTDNVYLTKLGGSLKEDALILSTDVTAADGTTGSVQTDSDIYRTDRAAFPSELNGTRGKLALDKDGKLIAILPRETDSYQRITVSSNNANYVTGADGVRIDVKHDAVVWKYDKDSDKYTQTTYDKVWSTLKGGTSLILCYNGAGKNDYIYIVDATADRDASVMVLKTKPNGSSNPFASLGAGTARLYKNGMAATAEDLRQYDVGIYDKNSNTIQVSDRRLTGVYEDASPNTTAPSTIKVMGYEFPVLSSAITDLQSFKIGNRMTLLLTADNRVAGVVTPSAATGTAVGIAQVSAGSSKVTLFDGNLVLEGENSLSEKAAAALDGKLVTVSSTRKGYLSLSKLTGNNVTAAIDLAAGTMGKAKLAPNVRFYDCVDGGAVIEVDKEDITLAKIPTSKISFVSLDYAGRVAYVVLNDVTGDCYQYGFFVYRTETKDSYDLNGNKDGTYTLHYISIDNGSSEEKKEVQTLASFRNGAAGGLAVSSTGKLAGSVILTELKDISRSSFDVDEMTLTTTDDIFPISEKVQCYNKTTESWYTPGEEGLAAAIGFADSLTVYYDKAPDQGGKIRLVVVK